MGCLFSCGFKFIRKLWQWLSLLPELILIASVYGTISIITVCPEKKTKIFCAVSSIELRRFSWYVIHCFSKRGITFRLHRPSFKGDITKKTFWSFFSGQSVDLSLLLLTYLPTYLIPFLYLFMFVGPLSACQPICCPYLYPYTTCHNISILSGSISMKLATNIHHVSGQCWKGFQGQRSKVKVTARSSLFSAWCCISVLSGGTSTKLDVDTDM